MPINRRVSQPVVVSKPQLFEVPEQRRRKVPSYLRPILKTLPIIGTRGDRRSLMLKYVTPNLHRYSQINGYACKFMPAYSAVDPADSKVVVIAILMSVYVNERPVDVPPTLRIADPDHKNWNEEILRFVLDLQAKRMTPRNPLA